MSSRDGSSLSDRERAILDGLAAKAEADDPFLAAALRGRRALTLHVPSVPGPLRHWAVGLAVAVLGLAVVLASLSASLVLGIVGVVLLFAGVGRMAVSAPWWPGRREPTPPPAPEE